MEQVAARYVVCLRGTIFENSSAYPFFSFVWGWLRLCSPHHIIRRMEPHSGTEIIKNKTIFHPVELSGKGPGMSNDFGEKDFVGLFGSSHWTGKFASACEFGSFGSPVWMGKSASACRFGCFGSPVWMGKSASACRFGCFGSPAWLGKLASACVLDLGRGPF